MDEVMMKRFVHANARMTHVILGVVLALSGLALAGCDRGGWSEPIIRVVKATDQTTHILLVHDDDRYVISSSESFDEHSGQLTGPRKGGAFSREDQADLMRRLEALDDARFEDTSECPEYRVRYESRDFEKRGCEDAAEVMALDALLVELYEDGEYISPSDETHAEQYEWSAP
jgi:hypothetical protein